MSCNLNNDTFVVINYLRTKVYSNTICDYWLICIVEPKTKQWRNFPGIFSLVTYQLFPTGKSNRRIIVELSLKVNDTSDRSFHEDLFASNSLEVSVLRIILFPKRLLREHDPSKGRVYVLMYYCNGDQTFVTSIRIIPIPITSKLQCDSLSFVSRSWPIDVLILSISLQCLLLTPPFSLLKLLTMLHTWWVSFPSVLITYNTYKLR